MKTKIRRIFSILMLVILILVIVTLTAGAIAKSNLAKQYPAPGQLVDVGGYKMHIHCTGQGSPTVILASGMSDFSVSWAYVQPEVAKYTRVCSYDRAGMGWSEPSPYPRTVSAMVEELHTLLANAGVEGPYVMVGHSMGGMLARVYAHNYPDEVIGMALVDSLHEERPVRLPEIAKANDEMIGQFRMFDLLSSTGIMALAPQSIPNRGFPDDAYAQYRAILATTSFFETAIAESNAIEESCADVRALRITSFGDMPLIVLSEGHEDTGTLFSDAENQKIWKELQIEQTELTALSSNSKHIIAEQSGPFIQLDQPELVIDAIRELLDAIQK
jgi:pimeloyl-ACP methyl ester carboxylesterase